ncbi:DUF3105 domain-containing protein [uncultured Cellulomonas sp.]|uniref:DUF3105 domain-containing protein n=1 Tax=uncultured Cellulomonas sp. TaxID=189682 RepID=UPI00262245AF|nr:DUF3105 domain-containing protein [uncultured Cellulomonas sp.]
MNDRRQQDNKARADKVAAMRTAQRRQQRRRDSIIIGVLGVFVLGLIGTTFAVVRAEDQEQAQQRAQLREAASRPIEGVQEYPELSQNHVTEPVVYEQFPPVGGDHASVWMNCGAYTSPVVNEQAVHSLEHGAVWIAYQADLPADQVQALTELAQSNNYTLLSPFDHLDGFSVVASAWGVQLALDDASDPRLEQFLVKYIQGEQTPEPGAPCTGGAGQA